MEFLQTIWTSLTTPNEGLIKIIFIPLSFLEAFIGMLFFTTILNIKSTTHRKIIYILCISILSLISKYAFPNLYSTIINMILWPLLVIFVFRVSVLKGILSEVVVFAITACLDFIVSKTLYLIL